MNENKHESKIRVGSLVEYCLDPRYPALKKELNSSKLRGKLRIAVGIVLADPDKHGYVKIQTAHSPYPSTATGDQVEVHTEFCKVISG